MPSGRVSTIVSLGNPAVWWTGILTFLASIIISISKKDKKMLVIFVAVIFQYIPWILVPRLTFIYHYFSIVPFIIFTIVYVIKYILEKYSYMRYYIFLYFGLVVALFIMFYPALSGTEVNSAYIQNLKWFDSWIF
jgi:dolichyl-phosphate-mannose--protein O-mannosyl transferase